MPISTNFAAPSSANLLVLPNDPKAKLFLAFISSDDPKTKQPWCPDVRATLPLIKATFSAADGEEVALVEVGQRPEYVLAYPLLTILSAHIITIDMERMFQVCG